MRILLLGEDGSLRALLQRLLEDAGLQCTAPSFHDPLPTETPELILLDLGLADARALQLLEQLRARPETARTPVMLLGTGAGRVRTSVDALRHRADDYLQRPLPAEQLISRIARHLGIPPPSLPEPHAVIPGTMPAATPATDDAALRMLTPEGGTFSEGDFPALLWACHVQAVSGRLDLVVEGTDPDRSVFFRDGRVVVIRSRRPEDRLEEFLFHRGLLTRTQSQEARARNLSSPRRLAAALAEDGIIKVREVLDVTREHLKDRVLSLLELREGSFRFVPDAAADPEIVVLDERPEALLWRGIRRKLPLERLLPILGGSSTLLQPEGRVDLGRFALKDEELAIAVQFDGGHTLEEISRNRPQELVWQLAFLLVTVGAARIAARGLEVGPADAHSAQRDAQIDRLRLAELHRRCQEASYFDLLGLSPQATRTEIQEALENLSATVRRERAAGRADLAPLLDGIEPVLGDCAQVLLNDRMRERYRSALPR